MTKHPRLEPIANLGLKGPVVVAIMDGVGIGRGDAADAVACAHTPHLDSYRQSPLSCQLNAHGRAVGMPSNSDMGNSEVGHNVMGAGRVFEQGASLVANAIQSGAIFATDTWQHIVQQCKNNSGALHLLGLLSDGNVHSHIDHLLALLDKAHSQDIQHVFIHTLLDGRDVAKTSALTYVAQLDAKLASINQHPQRSYRVASGGGRMRTTMDRYQANWPVVEQGWQVHVLGQGRGFASLQQAIETLRTQQPGINDQELPAFVIVEHDQPIGPIQDGDAVIAFNFRGDRMLQLCSAFEDDIFTHFDRQRHPDVLFAGMTQYDGDTQTPKNFLVHPPSIDCTFGQLLAEQGVSQLACSETQKFGHVTYFWNGNRSEPFNAKLETYIEVPSYPPPFDAKPQMRAPEIIDTVLQHLAKHNTRLTRLNLANGDMIGHTGNFQATIDAMQVVDQSIGRLVDQITAAHGAVIVTADHGNADDMAERDKNTGIILRDKNGQMITKTSHSLNPVMCAIMMHPKDAGRFSLSPAAAANPGLGNLAATAATLLGFQTPQLWLPSLLMTL